MNNACETYLDEKSQAGAVRHNNALLVEDGMVMATKKILPDSKIFTGYQDDEHNNKGSGKAGSGKEGDRKNGSGKKSSGKTGSGKSGGKAGRKKPTQGSRKREAPVKLKRLTPWKKKK